ncbi:choline dehydrogenase-like flavoprotein [Cylindrospermum stagnale PCC 7417]|uniref:Choline dehydrogenase-like flavoprotein n=1 Tax=Cylindrospermum stagnale PCC 7417 TaxID=56107 RepID=K9WSY1_9NOST|nr:GMC family oxidoreductase [Cylindrospermum stagnale]AFZ23490.1 choline dehydrogenase-like flavoprotein [Cylindrospermum stagnale PCC 7417]
MPQVNHFDVIIIGTGAGGGTLAYTLAPLGKRILLLEQGGYLPREKDNWDTHAVFLEKKYKSQETWYDETGKSHRSPTNYCVGGNTKFYGSTLMRFRTADFGKNIHYDGISPAWPLSYADFEPYYTEAEYLYHVHGQRGIDPTEPPATAPYRYPMVNHEPRIQQLFDDFCQLGYQPFPLPLGIMLDEADLQNSNCIRCNTCGGFPCLLEAKADAHTVCIRPALKNPNVKLITHARVQRLETSASGREVSKICVERNGILEEYSADIIVVACGAINSAALLLRSLNDKHPHGLANGSGVVGRHYMRHTNSSFIAISLEPNPTVFQKTFGLNDFYFGTEDWKYPMGNIQLLGKSTPELLAAELLPSAPEITKDTIAKNGIDFCLISEDLPDPDNRVTLNSKGEITLRYTSNNLSAHKHLINKFEEMLSQLGCADYLLPSSLYVGNNVSIAGINHQCGTIRFGEDPQNSSLDINCKAHELDNLYVVDGSFFVSSAAVNPALTIIANALRVGNHLKERLR